MLLSRREVVLCAGAAIVGSSFPALRDKFTAIKASADGMIGVVSAREGFARAPYIKRAAMGSTVHEGALHLGPGWDWKRQCLVDGHYRTRDFIVAERAASFTPNVCFQEMASFDGALWRGPGLDVYPAVIGNDLTNSEFHRFQNGEWQQAQNTPNDEFETGMLLATPEGLISGFGLKYNPAIPQNPTYIINHNVWRKPPGLAPWELRTSTAPALRSFAYMHCAHGSFLFGGADNTNGPEGRIDSGRVLRTTDGFATFTDAGPLPGGARYGLRGVWMGDIFVLIGGARGISPTVFSTEVWYSTTPWEPESFVEGTPLPMPMVHFAAGSLQINGQWTLGVIDGYPHADGGPLGTIFTTTDLEQPWQPRTESDFWVV